MESGDLGQMVTPNAGNRLTAPTFAIDNGCFSDTWTAQRWSATLDRYAGAPGCLFAVVPDVVADAQGTDDRWRAWWSAPMRRGYRAAYVAQDGCRQIPLGAKALFIGGSTEWKLSAHARRVASEAHRRRMWVHMGRVNSRRRMQYARDIGCHSVDGTYLAFAPDENLPKLLRWIDAVSSPSLFDMGVAS